MHLTILVLLLSQMQRGLQYKQKSLASNVSTVLMKSQDSRWTRIKAGRQAAESLTDLDITL